MNKRQYDYFNKSYPRIDSFAEAKRVYGSIKPINGKVRKKEHDVRPLGERGRHWERIWKVNKDQYAVGTWWWWRVTDDEDRKKYTLSQRDVSFHRTGEVRIYKLWGSDYGTLNIVNQVLPDDVFVERIDTICWVVLRRKDGEKNYYRIPENGPLRLKLDDHGDWQALNAPAVPRYRFDRDTARELMADAWEFREYVRSIWPMLDEETVGKQRDNGVWPYSLRDVETLETVVKDKKKWLPTVCAGKDYTKRFHYNHMDRKHWYTYTADPKYFLRSYVENPIVQKHKDKFVVEVVPPGEYVPRNRRFE